MIRSPESEASTAFWIVAKSSGTRRVVPWAALGSSPPLLPLSSSPPHAAKTSAPASTAPSARRAVIIGCPPLPLASVRHDDGAHHAAVGRPVDRAVVVVHARAVECRGVDAPGREAVGARSEER